MGLHRNSACERILVGRPASLSASGAAVIDIVRRAVRSVQRGERAHEFGVRGILGKSTPIRRHPYGDLAKFTEVLNAFVAANGVQSVIEFGAPALSCALSSVSRLRREPLCDRGV
jgi:hypothetical protein